ncbi:5-(carboxyamino)imidazole ribonucleotide synthase [Alteribacillus iranensis]|uniref:N5-carboxyaminoimidazole ribonucleotide synthase n=1 Tax=Alteribacillus iranensis TaxID=930128 RepID=A0A1I2E960_9BACI|nr:5-(carboxyamino)imidazole ribonucleotide synthase [Alteribacillus iranensis]
MSKFIAPGKTIGILGGGQLGRMMALAARAMGFRIAVMEPKLESPTGQVADVEVEAAYDDRRGALELAEHCDVLTYEFENIDSDTASFLEEKLYLPQGSNLLYTTQHRLREKRAIEEAGVKVAPYQPVHSLTDLKEGLKQLGYPSVLKTCRGGYDGKGQMVIKEEKQIETAFKDLGGAEKDLVLEQWIPFEKEISAIVTRSTNGETALFPVGENIHKNNILHQTIVPARITERTGETAKEIVRKLAEELELVGTLAVEMFVVGDGEIYVNELAPRPHNSGHYTIEACETSQFEQHIRAVCGWPLGSTKLLQSVVMTNLLGQHLPAVNTHIERFARKGHIHLYGKDEAKQGRKMGHWTVLDETQEAALETSNTIWQDILTKK